LSRGDFYSQKQGLFIEPWLL